MDKLKLGEEDRKRVWQKIEAEINSRITTEFEAFKKELADFFPKEEHARLFGIVQNTSFSVSKLKEAFLICQKRGKSSVGYYFGVLRKL